MKALILPSLSTTTRFPLWLRKTVHVLLASASWALLLNTALLTALGVGWILLGIVLLGGAPSADADPPPFARFFASARIVGLVLGTMFEQNLQPELFGTMTVERLRGDRPLGAAHLRFAAEQGHSGALRHQR